MIEIKKFLGLINTTDEEKQPLGALSLAENVCMTATGTIFRRDGYEKVIDASNITGSYGTTDNRYMFLINNGTLIYFDGANFRSLAAGLPIRPSFWCEESPNSVFVISGGAYYHIENGNQLTELHNLPPPTGEMNDLVLHTEGFPQDDVQALTFHQGSVVAAVSVTENVTRIQYSVPQNHHLFYKIQKRFEIPDRVFGLESVNGQLLIACAHNIYSFSTDSGLSQLADYGCTIGKPITKLADGGCMIATTRGLAAFPEFKNLTEAKYSYPPGKGAATALYETRGEKLLLVCTDGAGESYNAL